MVSRSDHLTLRSIVMQVPSCTDMSTICTMVGLREIRKSRGLTLEAVAYLAGVDTATISRIENQLVTPRPETVVKIARGLGVSIDRLSREAASE